MDEGVATCLPLELSSERLSSLDERTNGRLARVDGTLTRKGGTMHKSTEILDDASRATGPIQWKIVGLQILALEVLLDIRSLLVAQEREARRKKAKEKNGGV